MPRPDADPLPQTGSSSQPSFPRPSYGLADAELDRLRVAAALHTRSCNVGHAVGSSQRKPSHQQLPWQRVSSGPPRGQRGARCARGRAGRNRHEGVEPWTAAVNGARSRSGRRRIPRGVKEGEGERCRHSAPGETRRQEEWWREAGTTGCAKRRGNSRAQSHGGAVPGRATSGWGLQASRQK